MVFRIIAPNVSAGTVKVKSTIVFFPDVVVVVVEVLSAGVGVLFFLEEVEEEEEDEDSGKVSSESESEMVMTSLGGGRKGSAEDMEGPDV